MFLVRHAQPLIAPGVCYGALDVSADPQATRQAAQVLAQQLPSGLRIVTSPLQRCEQLTKTLCGLRPDLSYTTEARLAEMNFGCWEGQPWERIPQQAYDDWMANFWLHRFGGAESVAEFMARVRLAWQDVQLGGGSAAAPAQVWITHAGVIRALGLIANGVREVLDAAMWPTDAPAFGQMCFLRNAGLQIQTS